MYSKVNNKVTILLIAAAAALCLYGAFNGEAEAVFNKAIRICMECIGLG